MFVYVSYLLPVVAEQRGKFGDVGDPQAIEFFYVSYLAI